MNLKKSVFSYLMWFVYSLPVCVGLFGIAATLSRQAGFSPVIGFLLGGFWLLLGGLAVFFLSRLDHKEEPGCRRSSMSLSVLEGLLVVLLIGVGIALRTGGISDGGESAAYFEAAKVAEGQEIPSVVHGAAYTYLQFLHTVFLIFGNKAVAGICVQIVLQLGADFFLYLAVRRMAGAVSSLLVLGFLMLSPFAVAESLLLSPQMLFLLIYSIALLVCTLCVSGRKHLFLCLAAGAGAGAVCYLDIMGAALLVFAVAGILAAKSGGDEKLSRRTAGALLCLAGCGAAFFALITVDAVASGKDWYNVFSAWWRLYAPETFTIPYALQSQDTTVDVLILILLMAVGVFSYWRSRGTERQSVWIASAAVVVCLICFGMTAEEMNGGFMMYLFSILLAGVGIGAVLCPDRMADASEDAEAVSAEPEAAKTEEGAMRTVAQQPEMNQTAEPPVLRDERVLEEGLEMIDLSGIPKKVTFLENPLPLPKAHVKKVLDYDLKEFEEEMSDFDLDVSEDDDFDI